MNPLWLLGGLVVLAAYGKKAPAPKRGVMSKPDPIDPGLDCSRVGDLATLMANKLLDSYYANIPKDRRWTKSAMQANEAWWIGPVADWTYWELLREHGKEAPPIPVFPWADTLDVQGDAAYAWHYSGGASVSRRNSPWVDFGEKDPADWRDVECRAQLASEARRAVAHWYARNGLK